MTARRFHLAARRSLLLGLLLPALWHFQILSAVAEQRGGTAPRIERILVPQDSPKVWPRGEWRILRRSKVESLLQGNPTNNARTKPRGMIRRAIYSAVLVEDSLTSGQMTLTMERSDGASEFVSLDPLSAHASKLQWDHGPAIWGTRPKSGTVVFIDRERGTLTGQWGLPGATRPGGIDFDIRLPQAVASQLSLRLPRPFHLRASVGVVTTPTAEKTADWRVWTIELGRETRTRLTIDFKPTPTPRKPLIFLENSVTNLVAVSEQFRILCDLTNLTILEAPLHELELHVQDDVQVHSVVSNTDVSYPLREKVIDGIRQLTVRFDPPLQGGGHLLHVHASAPLPLDRQISLPRILVSGAALGRARLNLNVTAPLQLKKITTSKGYLEDNPVKGGDAVSLQSYGDAGEVTAVLGWPQPDLSCRVFSRLDPAPDQWKLRTRMLWQCGAGKQFSLRCLIPAAWDITSLRLANESGDLQTPDWRIVSAAGGRRSVVVNLHKSLTTDQPVTVEIEAIRPPPTKQEAVAIPAPVPLGTDNIETLFSIAGADGAQPRLEPGASFEAIAANNVPESWKQFELWKVDTDAARQSTSFLLSMTNQPTGKFSFQSEKTALNVAADINCMLSEGRVTETFRLNCGAAGTDVPRVHVFITEPGPVIAWNLVGEKPIPLKAKKLPTARHRPLNLPPSGELWEIQFPTDLAANFELTGSRVRPFPADGRAGFVFVPRTRAFQGQMTVVVNSDVSPRFESRNLIENPEVSSANAAAVSGKSYHWTYSSRDVGLQISTQSRAKTSYPPTVVAARLRSQMSSSGESYDLHWVAYDLRAFPKSVEFGWKMPAQAELISVQSGSQITKPLRDGDSYRVQPRLDDRDSRVTIHYRTPAASWLGWTTRRLPLPELNVPLLRFEWELVLPPKTSPCVDFSDATVTNALSSSTWPRRLFGPLHKTNRTEITVHENGLSEARAPLTGTFSPEDGPPKPALGLPPGWRVWKVAFSRTPETLQVILWNRQQSKLAASALLILCLLTAFGLRTYGLTVTRRRFAFWLMSCLTIAAVVPAAYAEIAGGLVIGSLLACLMPLVEKMALSKNHDPTASVPDGSTRMFVPTATGCLLAAICCWGQNNVQGQETAGEKSRKATSKSASLRVLIPYKPDDLLGEKSAWVYVEQAALEKFNAWEHADSKPPGYLLSAAEYELHINEQAIATCRSRFTVDILSSAEEVKVHLPLSITNLVAGDACRVNGQPHSVWNATDGTGLVLRLKGFSIAATDVTQTITDPSAEGDSKTQNSVPPQSRRDVIELSMYVPVTQTEDRQRAQFQIPRVADTRLSVHVPQAYPYIHTRCDGRHPIESRRPVDQEPAPILLGNTSRIEVSWSAKSSPDTLLEAASTCLLEVSPSLIQYHARVLYRVPHGTVSHVSWKLPADVAVRSISGPHVIGHQIAAAKDGSRFVQIDFNEPQSEGFEVEAKFLLPVKIQGELLTAPLLNLVPNSAMTAGEHHSQVIGVTAPDEFRLDVINGETDGITQMPVKSFADRWTKKSPKPRFAMKVEKQANLTLRIRPLTPVRQVSTVFSGHLTSRVLEWELLAQMNVTEALAFQHRLQIDPRLRIETISVQQEDAERLRRKTLTPDQLVLFLKTGAIGRQTIRITGSMPLKFPTLFSLPSIGFFDATLTGAEVILSQDADLSVTTEGTDGLLRDSLDGAPTPLPSDRLLVGRFQLPAGTDMQELRIQTAENSPRIVMDSISALDMRAGSQKMTTILFFRVLEGHASEFSIRVPRQFEETYEIDSPHTPQKIRGDGGLELTFLPEKPGQRDFTVRLTVPIEPAENGSLTLNEIAPVNAKLGERFLLTLSDDDSFGPAAQFSGLTDEELSSNLIARIPEDLALDLPRSFRGEPGPWRLQSRNQPKNENRVVLSSDTQLWLNNSSLLSGRTTFLVMPSDEEKLVVVLPLGAKLRTALTDDGRPAVTSIADQEVTVSLDAAQVGQVVTLYWSIPGTRHSIPWNLQLACRAPWPRDFEVNQSTLAIIPPKHMVLKPTARGERETSTAYSLSRLEAEFDFLQAQTNAGHTQQQRLWREFRQHHRQVAELFGQPPASLSQSGVRFADLSKRVNSYQPEAMNEAAAFPGEDLAIAETISDFSTRPGSLFYIWKGDAVEPTAERVWTIDIRFFYGVVAAVTIPLLLIGRKIYRRRISFSGLDWLLVHPRIAWSLVGIAWWLFLVPSWLGLGITATAFLSRWWRQPTPESAVTTEVDFMVAPS